MLDRRTNERPANSFPPPFGQKKSFLCPAICNMYSEENSFIFHSSLAPSKNNDSKDDIIRIDWKMHCERYSKHEKGKYIEDANFWKQAKDHPLGSDLRQTNEFPTRYSSEAKFDFLSFFFYQNFDLFRQEKASDDSTKFFRANQKLIVIHELNFPFFFF